VRIILCVRGKFSSFKSAYIAIGHVSGAVGSEMKPFLDSIMLNIKQALQLRGYVALTVFTSTH
jgi:hypothetical protein